MLRHPAVRKEEVFATIAEGLADDPSWGGGTFEGRIHNLNDITVGLSNRILAAERKAGAVINSIWPPVTRHSSQVLFQVKG